jgi:Fe2+ or Zn2+ uptake regulation protein
MKRGEARTDGLLLSTADDWHARAVEALLAAGCRNTAPRHAVLDWIASRCTPFTAEILVAALERQQGLSSRPTIYRTLEWLRAEGWIARVQSDENAHTYVRRLPGHYHQVICTQCGHTLIMRGCTIEHALVPALSSIDFEVHGHVLELYGVCGSCRVEQPAP